MVFLSLGNSSEDRKFYWKYKKEAEHFRTRKLVKLQLKDESEIEEGVSGQTIQKSEIPFKYSFWNF